MLKRALIVLALFSVSPAQAGLFSDDEARKQVQAVQEKVQQLEADLKQSTQSILDLQSQIDTMSAENRSLRGQNEELLNGLQREEKRAKDLYLDLDTRLRRLEPAAAPVGSQVGDGAATPGITFVDGGPDGGRSAGGTRQAGSFDPAQENRALEAGFAFLKAQNFSAAANAFKNFITHYADSVQIPNAIFGLGNAYYGGQNFKDALMVYQNFLKDYPNSPRAPDVLLNIAGCQSSLQQDKLAQKTLKQLVSKYPNSSAAAQAKRLLAGK